MERERRFNLHLPGLLEVLAGSLYSTPKVGVRELVQNAHDSCIRRKLEGGERDYQPRIEVDIDVENQILTVWDNGQGLTMEGIELYLATIGRSYTRGLKEEQSFFVPEEAGALIGQFGFGFLSAFLLADEVSLHTLAGEEGSKPLIWESKGGELYTVRPGDRQEAGSAVHLKLKPTLSFLFQEDILREVIQQYADFLAIPIYMKGEEEPVNLMQPPWLAEDMSTAVVDYIKRVFYEVAPLCIIPLKNELIDLGGDSYEVPLQGFLFIPPASVASVREYGDVNVYIRRMFIQDQERKLLPNWARFVRGVIDSPLLQPTASREAIHQDEGFVAVQKAIEKQLGEGLEKIAAEQPELWRQIVYGHSDIIMGWAVRDATFFERMADLVIFRTSRGVYRLPEYLSMTEGKIYYLTRHLGALQEKLLAESHDAPVIDAHWFSVEPFLEKYAATRKWVQLVKMDGDIGQLLQPMEEDQFERLLGYYRGQGIQVQLVKFRPENMPALMVYPQDAEFLLEARQIVEQEDEDPFADLIENYLEERIEADADAVRGRLYLNGGCRLVQRLAERPLGDENTIALLSLIYQTARLFSGRALTTEDATDAFGEMVRSMEVFI